MFALEKGRETYGLGDIYGNNRHSDWNIYEEEKCTWLKI
jgi:hypothetical protein